MKLLNFKADGALFFGFVAGDFFIPFNSPQLSDSQENGPLCCMEHYLEQLPESFKQASELNRKANRLIDSGETGQFYTQEQIRILPPLLKPASLIDFGLTPKHLKNSAMTMMKHQMGPVLGRIIGHILGKRVKKMSQSDIPPYYKANHLTIIGDNDEIGWPDYTSYLDIEPELAVVIGNKDCRIAGYTIYNDASARDVQFPEMIGTGPARSKDFEDGNGLGPFLVTPDEISDPLNLKVKVQIGNRDVWNGHTSEYSMSPEGVVDYLDSFFGLQPGTVVGMGTIPDCTGLDHDKWLLPGDEVKISFDGLGTLHQLIPSKLPAIKPSKWKDRPELLKHQEPATAPSA
jgi:2-keto-4-pentenoate hydratase/2-oxohepta-3-ene-1,7-dioic acid hydratase in catechol pathway